MWALQADKGGLGAHSAPNPDRHACSIHVPSNGYDNTRSVDREAPEGGGRDARRCAFVNKLTLAQELVDGYSAGRSELRALR